MRCKSLGFFSCTHTYVCVRSSPYDVRERICAFELNVFVCMCVVWLARQARAYAAQLDYVLSVVHTTHIFYSLYDILNFSSSIQAALGMES